MPGGGKLPRSRIAQTRNGRVSYCLSGEGSPAIVLLAGAGVTLEGWRFLYPEIETLGTVFGFNRFGLKGSDAPRRPQSGAFVVDLLRELLAQVSLAPPYLLVGHSLGGLYANLFARLHPADTAGVLLLEATHPDDHAVVGQHETLLARALSKVLALPQVVFRRNLHAELDWLSQTVREIEASGPFPLVPLTVVTGGNSPPNWLLSPAAAGAKRAHQQELARLSPLGRQVVAQHSGHFPQLTQPQLVLRELRELIHRAREAQHVGG